MGIKIGKTLLKIKAIFVVLFLFYKIIGFGTNVFCASTFGSGLFGSSQFGSSQFGQNSSSQNSPSSNLFGSNSLGLNIFGQNQAGQVPAGQNIFDSNKTGPEKEPEKEIEDKTKYPVMEKVILYAKKSDNSNEKIIRKGILSKPKNAKANVVLCHGFTCDKSDIGFMRYMFEDCNCLTFDFRAHGENIDGQCCTLGKNEAYDVKAAFDFLKSHPATKGLVNIVYAFSMGSVAAIEAQSKFGHLYDAGIFDCPFDRTESVINRGLDNKKIAIFGYEFDIPGKIILRKYLFHPYVQSFVKAMLRCAEQLNGKSVNTLVCPVNTAESIKKVNVPCLFIHCKNDEKISIDSIKSVYYNAGSMYKKLWLTEGKKHFGSFFDDPEKYARKIDKFVSKVVSGQLYIKNKHKIIEEPTQMDDLKGAIEILAQENEKSSKESLSKQLLAKNMNKLKGSTEIAIAVKDVKLTKNGGSHGKK